MPKPRIFVSSTFYDLQQVRADLERFIQDLGYESVRHETGAIAYGAELPLEEYAYQEIDSCDILVSLIGGRFGTQSAADSNRSISQSELERALAKGVQVFIFVNKHVRSEYDTYQLNKGTAGIKYRYVDDPRIYAFIEELFRLPVNNPISTFETGSDITEYLRAQWAGLFRRFLHESRGDGDNKLANAAPMRPGQVSKIQTATDRVDQLDPFRDGIVTLVWLPGSNCLDVELATTVDVLENVTLQVFGIHRWSDEHPRFVESSDVNERGRFAPIILHAQRAASKDAYVWSQASYPLFRNVPQKFVFLTLSPNCLEFSGQRGSGLVTYTLRSSGTWRVCFRVSLREPQGPFPDHRLEQTGMTFLYFRWDGASVPAPCDPPVIP